ncbi:unnamed protein product [Microthlaspi erraticum]|uniref:Protein kinase domain-containing protein n=1 Tax=Microthlaspi erraticum TaxID=1685480 RepID=A0A6D2K9G9_9BRAS|nr:unnamed protein product [Microthlaspi erraticum]
MQELNRRRIKVVEDKGEVSFKTAMKADLVIAGSAVCTSWIDQYMNHHPAGGSQIAWWIMENRREYFDRAKPVLDRVKMLIFLSESQSKQWLTWCEEESIKLRSQPVIVPLSVNDELAFVAGIPSSLNTPTLTPEKMKEKRQTLRESVRAELGLTDADMLVMSLSSINPPKGQLHLLESVALALAEREQEGQRSLKGVTKKEKVSLLSKHRLRGSARQMQSVSHTLDNGVIKEKQELKVLLGSVGSKSNKVGYVKEMLSFLSSNRNLSKSVIWTPATTRVASLYSAADVYVTNSQGVGETFGRVTIEAMAYGLAVVGTDAGGTKEMVRHNVTGLLHSMGRSGNKELARNLLFLLRNPDKRLQFGVQGRKKVEEMYMKQHMYKRFVDVLVKYFYVFPVNGEADQVNHSGKGGRVPYIWIVGGLGVVLALLVMCILVCICMRSSSCSSSSDEDGGGGHNFQILRKSGFFCGSGRYNCCRSGDIRQTNGETQSHHQVVSIPKALGDGMFEIEKPVVFTYDEIRAATDEFSDSNLLGHGNYGSVYFGLLREQEVAVKRMTATKTKEFAAEMKVLCKVHHSNLVELIGYAATVDELFVVYEYVQKGMLKNHLHEPQSKGNTPLSWIMRNQIALDAARGLEYIHEHTKTHYVHRDIKTSNILLDEAFRAKISDFGLAKLVEKTGDGEISVTKVVGTYGYLAPEYLSDGLATPKSDVYRLVLFCLRSSLEEKLL